MTQARTAPLVALVLLTFLLLPACGAPDSGTPAPAAGGFPVEVEGARIPAEPQRIVSASASHTEILYAIGVGDRVVATDQFSDYPPAAEGKPKFEAFNLGVETLVTFDPDLVVLAFDPGELQDGLAALGIPVLLLPPPATLEDVYRQIQVLGEATGRREAAAALEEDISASIGRLAAGVPHAAAPLTYYYELDPTFYSLTSRSFVGGMLALLNLESIADAADDGSGFPQLSAEYILQADPDYILLADTRCCGQSAATVAARPGWSGLTAVASGRVVGLDDDVAQRWGPRLVDLLAAVAAAVYGEGEAG